MQLSIIDDTHTTPGDKRRGVDLTQFKAGDKLEARIVRIASSGRTVLQFVGFKAVVDRLAGAREGDVMRFEVLPDEKPATRFVQTDRSSTALSNKSTGAPGQNAGPQFNKIVRLNPLTDTSALRGKGNETSILMSKPVSQAPAFTLASTTQATLPAHSFEIVSTWFRRFQKNRQFPGRSGEPRLPSDTKTKFFKGLSIEKSAERPGMVEPEYVDRPREPHSSAGYSIFHLGDWPVKMKIYGFPPENRTDKDKNYFKAIFLLNFEYTGAVRADIQMKGNEINVGFFVESEDCRTDFAKALPELRAALSPLARHCYCHVTVSPVKIHDFLSEEGDYPDNPRFDIRA